MSSASQDSDAGSAARANIFSVSVDVTETLKEESKSRKKVKILPAA
jgi:hypothetical protein